MRGVRRSVRPAHAFIALALVLIWALAYWSAWHFDWRSLILPLGVASLAVPAAFGYASVSALPIRTLEHRMDSAWMVLIAVIFFAVAYACSIYAIGRVVDLLPEIYKFDTTVVDVSRSTLRLWFAFCVGSFIGSVISCGSFRIGPKANLLCRATIGIVVGTAIPFIPFLLSPYVVYRA
jgi:hypothetical protein